MVTPENRPTATKAVVATQAPIVPLGSAKFSGSFDSGTFSFNTNGRGTYVTLKQIILKKAVCNTGQKISQQLTFEDVQFFQVVDGKFTISFDRATVSGQFTNPTTASGSIWINILENQCKIGPLFWTARAAVQ
jgi:hypothetical protein